MALVTHFTELRVYQEAFEAAMRIFELSRDWPTGERPSLTDQTCQGSRSVCGSIAEAWRKRGYLSHFISKLTEADGQAAETQNWLKFAFRYGYLAEQAYEELWDSYEHITQGLVGMMTNAETWCDPLQPARKSVAEHTVRPESQAASLLHPDTYDLRHLFLRHLCQTSDSPMGLVADKARGARLFTADGLEYLDFLSGLCVANVGHCHPAVVEAIKDQAERYLHVMVYGEFVQQPQVELASKLASVLPEQLSVVYFTSSGTEANEGALKLAKKHTLRKRLVAFDQSFHGDSQGSCSVTGREVYRKPFEPLLPGVTFLPFNDASALSAIDSSVAAVIAEPIQGEGGVRIPSAEFMTALRQRCTDTGALLIFDEVQTGFGRTGKLFAFEHFGVVPDILTLAKGMGGGMPLGAFVSSPEIMHTLSVDPPLSHVTTFGGHPVCCAAALASLNVILSEGLPDRAAKLGERLRHELREMQQTVAGISDVRGLGLLIGLELESAELTRRFVERCLSEGLLLGWTLHSDRLVRIAPPLTIREEDLAAGIAIIRGSLEAE